MEIISSENVMLLDDGGGVTFLSQDGAKVFLTIPNFVSPEAALEISEIDKTLEENGVGHELRMIMAIAGVISVNSSGRVLASIMTASGGV